MSFFLKNKYIKKNLTFLVLVFKIKHLFIRSNNLPCRNVSIFKWLVNANKCCKCNFCDNNWICFIRSVKMRVKRRISWLILFAGSVVLSLILQSLLMIKGGKEEKKKKSTPPASWRNSGNRVKVGKCVTLHAASYPKVGLWSCCSHHVVFLVLFVYCATKLIITSLLLLSTRKLLRHQHNDEAENV